MAVAIALADDSVIVREGVARVLAAQPDMEVVVSCGDLPSLLEAVDERTPRRGGDRHPDAADEH